MMVLAVLAILVAVGYPIYQGQMIENRRTDGQRLLLEIMNEQLKFHSRNSSYTADLVAGGNIGLTYPDPNGNGTVPSDKGFYLVTAAVCDIATPITDCVLLTATPQSGQVGDGQLTYNSRNEKTPLGKW